MNALKFYSLVASASFLSCGIASSAERVTSKYTSTAQRDNIEFRRDQEDPTGFQGLFRGFGGYQLVFLGGDERSWINVRFGQKTADLRETTMAMGSALGSFPHKANAVVEWRGVEENGRFTPYAIIYRLVGLDENGKRKRTRLLVIKLDQERSAIIGQAEGPNEEKESRAIADKAHR